MAEKNWMYTKYIAHRGLFDNKKIPENSLSAFEKAIENGYAIEMDVQMTSDGVLTVFHDDNMKRMTGLDADIRETPFETVKNLTLIGTDCKIPTFDEFLQTVNGRTELVIEIKTHKNIGGVEQKVYDRLTSYNGSYCIESFNPFIVRWFKKHAPKIIRGQLSCDYEDSGFPKWKKNLLKKLAFCRWNGSMFIAYDALSLKDNKYVAKYRKKIPVITWTIKSQKQLTELLPYYDNIIFDSFIPERIDETEIKK